MSETEAKPVEIVLTVQDVRLRLGELQVLENIGFEIRNRLRPGQPTGQVVGLLGPSGVGKTQILRILAGLRAPDSGSVLGADGKPLAKGSVGVVFQSYPLLSHRTVRGNLEVAGKCAGMNAEKSRARADELLARFKLTERADYYPAQLSGGQRQRVAIAQQIVNPNALLLMDEPFSGLDPAALLVVQRLIAEVANMDDLNTVVLVTHDVRAALAVSDTVVLLGRDRDASGRIISGAKVMGAYDLVAEGLMWHEDVESLPAFGALEREIRGKFATL
jgi:polar amino acid transport system ATP-binding protein/sulfate transport system ATP-binding protein